MNLQENFTNSNRDLQAVLENWDRKILPRLPKELDAAAQQAGIMHRKRGIHSASDLLKALFLYAASKISFRMLAAAACALGIARISNTAWRKQFAGSVPFLRELLHAMLSSFLPEMDVSAFEGVKNVLLADASVVRQEGIQQEQQRIHLCYSLNENRMKQVKVTDKHTAESLAHFSVEKGDLILADAGYGTARNYIYAQEKQADVILRITPGKFCLYDADGKKISLVEMLKDAEEKNRSMVDVFGFCKYNKDSGFVRVVAQKLPEEKSEEARRRKKRKAAKNQKRIKEETLFCAGWIVVITSLGAEYSSEEILHLYRSRWQVELLFKRFKQNFSITTIKAGSTVYVEAMVYLWLIIWTMAERQAFLADCYFMKKEEDVYSIYNDKSVKRYILLNYISEIEKIEYIAEKTRHLHTFLL